MMNRKTLSVAALATSVAAAAVLIAVWKRSRKNVPKAAEKVQSSDVVGVILDFLGEHDLLATSTVCKRWHRMSNNSQFWHDKLIAKQDTWYVTEAQMQHAEEVCDTPKKLYLMLRHVENENIVKLSAKRGRARVRAVLAGPPAAAAAAPATGGDEKDKDENDEKEAKAAEGEEKEKEEPKAVSRKYKRFGKRSGEGKADGKESKEDTQRDEKAEVDRLHRPAELERRLGRADPDLLPLFVIGNRKEDVFWCLLCHLVGLIAAVLCRVTPGHLVGSLSYALPWLMAFRSLRWGLAGCAIGGVWRVYSYEAYHDEFRKFKRKRREAWAAGAACVGLGLIGCVAVRLLPYNPNSLSGLIAGAGSPGLFEELNDLYDAASRWQSPAAAAKR